MGISVIVPCYQQSHYLAEAIRSVKAQTRSDWELIVAAGCDDCATEAKKHVEARVLEGLHDGAAHARNVAVDAASHDYILNLDADDMMEPTMLDRLASVVDPNAKEMIVSTGIRRFGRDTGVSTWPPPFDRTALPEANQLPTSSIFTKALWRKAGGYNVALIGYEDWNFWIDCCYRGAPLVRHISDPLLLYRVHDASSTHRTAHWDEVQRAMIRLLHPELHSPQRLAASRQILERAPADAIERLRRRAERFPDNPDIRQFLTLVTH